MRWSRPTLALSGALLLAGCGAIGSTIDRLPDNAASRGFVTVSRPVSLPRSRLTSDCGPESICAVINYWGKPASVQEISLLVRDENMKGIPTILLPGLARRKGMKAASIPGSVGRIKNAVDRDVPPIIMVKLGNGLFHFFVVSGYSDREQMIVCEEWEGQKRLIGYGEIEDPWKAAGYLLMEFERSTAEDDFQAGAEREGKGRYGEAIVLYKRAVETDPSHFEARVGLGNCYLFTQKLDEALAEYKRAYELNSVDPKVCNNLANVYIELKRDAPEAERLAGSAVDQYQADVRRAKEDIAHEPQPSFRAIRQKELVSKELDLADALGTLGQARALGGRHELAVAAWRASIDHYPLTEFESRARRLYEIALSQRQLSMPADARRTLEAALEEAGKSSNVPLREKIEAALKR